MKSYTGLFQPIVDPANLRAAMTRAALGKKDRGPVARFLADAPRELECLRWELTLGTYRPLPYTQFGITDPKPRRISCADFRDRVVHHAVCNVIGPVIERRFIADSFACRAGFGGHRAVLRARALTRRFGYCLKTDVRKFYDSVDHGVLLGMLGKSFRERELLDLLETIVRHPVPGQQPGKGLPIGNLTSQWFANLYLDRLDHLVKDDLGVKGYVRYMDDLALWADGKAPLWGWLREIEAFAGTELRLTLNPDRTVLAPVSEGVPFLGYRVFPNLLRRQGNRLRRSRRMLRRREGEFERGEITADQLVASVRSLAGPRQFFGTGEPVVSGLDV